MASDCGVAFPVASLMMSPTLGTLVLLFKAGLEGLKLERRGPLIPRENGRWLRRIQQSFSSTHPALSCHV